MKCITTKYGNKLGITIDFKGEAVDIFASKQFDSTAADFEDKLKKLHKGMILNVIERFF